MPPRMPPAMPHFQDRFVKTGCPALLALVVATACSFAGDGIAPPATQPTTSAPSTQPADAATSGDPVADEILDRLDARGETIKGLACKVIYRYVTVFPAESVQQKDGTLLFAKADPNARFLIHFTKLSADGIERETGEYWAFDGRWLTERNDKSRTIIKREIAAPGERKDPFKLGQGPFPLPLGQKRRDILENFTVRLEKFTLGDPRGSDHLHCVPKPGTPLARKYTRVDIYVDRAAGLPVRIVTERVSDANRIEVDFKSIDTNEAPAASRFSIDEPKDYDVSVEPLESADAAGVLP